MKKLISSLLITCLSMIGVAQAVGNAQSGEQKSAACTACHGQGGKTPVLPNAPKLAGQHASYITEQLNAFKRSVDENFAKDNKGETRSDPTMAAMTLSLTPESIADLAIYFASQSVTHEAITATERDNAQTLYRGGNQKTGVAACIACHGPHGTGNAAAKFPSISGQSVNYVTKALKDFRGNTRQSSHNGMMNGVAARMTDTEIDAIAKYVSALH